MNNKGQVLVLFILILPIICLVLAALVEIGDLLIYKHKLENNAKYIVDYGMKNIDDLNIKTQLEILNKENFDGKAIITVDEEWITIYVKQTKANVFSFINIPLTVDFTYKGVKKGEKIIIQKE